MMQERSNLEINYTIYRELVCGVLNVFEKLPLPILHSYTEIPLHVIKCNDFIVDKKNQE